MYQDDEGVYLLFLLVFDDANTVFIVRQFVGVLSILDAATNNLVQLIMTLNPEAMLSNATETVTTDQLTRTQQTGFLPCRKVRYRRH
jgi:hypothetical protein